jgi:AraC-like DNA-binding protein
MSAPSTVEPTILGTMLLPITQELQKRGFDAVEIMSHAGIDPGKLANPDWRITSSAFQGLMRRCIDLTEDEAFGLCAAEQLQPQVLHGLGLGWLASDTVYDGLRRFVRFGKLVTSIADLELEETDDLVLLRMRAIADPPPDYEYAVRDYAVGFTVKMCRLNLGHFLAPVKIEIARPKPREPERWEYMLAGRVEFDQEATRVIWSRSDIKDKLVTGDPDLARANDEQAAACIDSFRNSSFARKVVEKIVARLSDGPPDLQLIADDLFMSGRTMQRKLKDEDVSFNELLQDCRLQLAKNHLRLHHRSVVEVCYLLGFSEPSAFSKAFKRWTGQTPAEYRNEALQL